MKYIIDEKLVNAILNYLANRPYIEVANLIQGMNGMTVYSEEIESDIEKDKALRNMVENEAKKYQKMSEGKQEKEVVNVGPAHFTKTAGTKHG